VVEGTNQISRGDERPLPGAAPADPPGLDAAAIELEPTELERTELELAEALEAAAPPTRPRAFLR